MGDSQRGQQSGTSYQHRVVAWWTSGRTGIAKSSLAPTALHFTAPAQFGGLEGRWTPEELLLAAVASCFTTTFHVLADRSQFRYVDLEVESVGDIEKLESGYMFREIVTRPRLTISRSDDEPRGQALLQKAERMCLVARALNVPHRTEPTVQLKDASGQH
jgi:organic hydroperoxide reductase OsmC/OhrA